MAKVLLVDDDLTMVQMVTELLRQEGHEVFPLHQRERSFGRLDRTLARIGHHGPLLR